MLKPRGFVPWGLPGPTRDAAALAASTRNLNSPDSVREWPGGGLRLGVAGGGRVGVGPTDYTPSLPMQPSGRPWAPKRTPGKLIMSSIIFFMDGEVRNYKGEL